MTQSKQTISPLKWLYDRASWLEKERRSGGNYEHLTARLEECQYISRSLANHFSAHDDLVNALKDLKDEIDGVAYGNFKSVRLEVLEAATAALAKAGGAK